MHKKYNNSKNVPLDQCNRQRDRIQFPDAFLKTYKHLPNENGYIFIECMKKTLLENTEIPSEIQK